MRPNASSPGTDKTSPNNHPRSGRPRLMGFHLVRLVTPAGGLILDYMGGGSRERRSSKATGSSASSRKRRSYRSPRARISHAFAKREGRHCPV